MYAPVLVLVFLMVFIFFFSTLPSLKRNQHLNRVRTQRIEEIQKLQEEQRRLDRLKDALENDPLTIENQLRDRFEGAGSGDEVEIDRLLSR